MTKLRYRPQT